MLLCRYTNRDKTEEVAVASFRTCCPFVIIILPDLLRTVYLYVYPLFSMYLSPTPRFTELSGYRHRGPGFDSRPYQIFLEVVILEWGPLSLVRITEELLA
jgi:hypothetical protein